MEAFQTFGLPIWLMVYVGVFEIVAAVMLFLKRWATYGAIIGVISKRSNTQRQEIRKIFKTMYGKVQDIFLS